MRYLEIISGVRIPVSEEEQNILDLASKDGGIDPSSLEERDEEVARKMVSRGLLKGSMHDGKKHLVLNDASDLWRY